MADHRNPDADLLAKALTHFYRRVTGTSSNGPSRKAVATAVHDWILAPAAERKAVAQQALAKAAGQVVADVMDSAADSVCEAADRAREAAQARPDAGTPERPAKRSTRPDSATRKRKASPARAGAESATRKRSRS